MLVRLVAYAAGAALFGAPLFGLYSPAAGGAAPRAVKRLLTGAAAGAALAAAAALIVQTGEMAGDPAAGLDMATLREVAFGSGFGISVLARFGAGLLALAVLAADRGGRPPRVLLTAAGAIVLAALAWAGHGAADEGLAGRVHLAADVVHLLASGAWLGALLMLHLLLHAPEARAFPRAGVHAAFAGFSGVGSAIVAVIVASGLANGWFLAGPQHVAELARSPWGVLLLIKLILFLGMLGLAALNRYRLTPQLEASLAGHPEAALAHLRRSLAIEAALGGAVLAIVAALGLLPPPAST